VGAPTLSVAICTYNGEFHLREQLADGVLGARHAPLCPVLGRLPAVSQGRDRQDMITCTAQRSCERTLCAVFR
jgi:hypothetical protein